ncbi:SH3 domain-containing protein [Alphaproteobacteria bacterium]|nr:SH3 domain-containing protein [Alphaproteobacteria bacterium]
MLKLTTLKNVYTILFPLKFIFLTLLFVVLFSRTGLPENYIPKDKINGSGLKIPRVVSLKNSLTYMRSGPGKKYPVIFEIRQKGYPLKITAEFNNWRKVITSDNLTGWIHTQLLSSFRTGIILDTILLKKSPTNKSRTKAKLLPKLIVNIIRCDLKWCKIEIVKEKTHSGWIKKKAVWGALLN